MSSPTTSPMTSPAPSAAAGTAGTPGTHAPDLAAARARNESVFRASAIALYAGEIEEFLRYWVPAPRYVVAYPVDGLPAAIEGRDQFCAVFGGLAAAARHIEVRNVRLHQTDDPDVMFVEEHMVIDLPSGERYENDLAIRATFRDGLIHDLFEYYGQLAHQRLADLVTGRAPS